SLPEARSASVYPGDRGLCVSTGASIACNTRRRALAGEVMSIELCVPHAPRGRARLVGLLPHHARGVLIAFSAGRTLWSVLSLNVYDVVVDGLPSAVMWKRQGRQYEKAIPIPDGFSLDQCAATP